MRGTIIDITEIKKTEQTLREREVHFRTLYESANDSIFLMDSDVFIDCNRKTLKVFGCAYNQIIGKPPYEFSPEFQPDGRKSKEAAIEKIRRTYSGDEQFFEWVHKKYDGTLFYAEVSLNIVELKNKTLVQAIVRDISGRKKTELELIKAKESAEESNRLKSAFINNISHEIRTPLSGILGFGQLLSQPGLDDAKKAQLFVFLQKSTNRLLQTVTDYLDISMIATGNIRTSFREFNIKDTLEEIYNNTINKAKDKGLELKFDFPEDVSECNIYSDQELLTKLTGHLLDNAVKFTSQGEIILGVRKQENFRVYVKDTGIGIDEEKQSIIFDTFIQEDTALSRGYEGSGLGLAIVKGIASILGGELGVNSVKGKGSEFYLILHHELKNGISEPVVSISKKEYKEGGYKILIAEDDEINYEVLNYFLLEDNFKTIHAKNGMEAIEYCKKDPEIDLVLMDIKMPVVDGINAARQIKEFQNDIPIIAVTAYAKSGQETAIRESGCNYILAKPFSSKELAKLLSTFLHIEGKNDKLQSKV